MRAFRIAHWGALIAVVAALPAVAAAGPSIVSGGPRADADRTRFDGALAEVAGPLSVCWRGKRPDAVVIELSVGADGQVSSAKAKTRGKVAVCAAAVLAVQKLAPARKGYRATVSFETRGAGGGGDREAVMNGLQADRSLRACYENRAKLSGELQLRFLVKPNGRVVDVEVVRSTVDDQAVQQCLIKALGAVRLAKLSSGKTVEFVLPFRFDGRGASTGKGADPSLQPSKKGPLDAAILTQVMNDAKARFSACYDDRLAKKPNLAGDVVLRYTVRADGKPYNVKIKRSTLGDPVVEQCVVAVGKMLRFPKSPGRKDTKVIYPFRFAQR